MAWACSPGFTPSVGGLWGHCEREGGVWESTLTPPGHTGTWQRKGGRGTGFQSRVLGQTQGQRAENPQGSLPMEACPRPRGVQRWAGGGVALGGRRRHCSHTLGRLSRCVLRSARRRVEREVGHAGCCWAPSIFSLHRVWLPFPRSLPLQGPGRCCSSRTTPAPHCQEGAMRPHLPPLLLGKDTAASDPD